MTEKAQRLKILNREAIKYLALIPMAIGHYFSYVTDFEAISDVPFWLTILTQMALFAPPIFFFFIAESFHYTRSRKKFAIRLLIFAIITQIPYCLACNGTLLTTELFTTYNIFFTLFLGVIVLTIWEKNLSLKKKIILILLIDIATILLSCEWMIFGILLILGFYIFRDNPKKRLLWFGGCILLEQIVELVFIHSLSLFLLNIAFFALSYMCVTIFYNGQKGEHPIFTKWFFYLFYPLHLTAIWVVKCLII